MNFPKLLYEEFKKLRKEKQKVSKHLNKIDCEHFLFLKRNLFSVSNFEKLDNTKKILFSDEAEFENQKFIFEELNDFRILRKLLLISICLFSAKRFCFGKADLLSSNFNLQNFLKEKILNAPKMFLLKFSIFTIFSASAFHCEKVFFEIEIANKITINSRLGVFLWFESNYRRGLINTNTINFLDAHMQKESNLLNKSVICELNETLMHNLLFFALAKQHFFDFYASKTLQNVILPLLDFQSKTTVNASEAEIQKFLHALLKKNFLKISKEKFFSFESEMKEEKNLKAVGFNLFGYLNAFVKGLFSVTVSGNSLNLSDFGNENAIEDDKGKLILNENMLGSLIRIEELKQIYLNDFLLEKLKEFYEDFNEN